jgi:hypothetical protein
VLIDGIVAVVVVALVVAAVVLLRRSQDDAHSVEHYHRQLHTLEEISSHPSVGDDSAAPTGSDNGENGASREVYPASAFRVSGTPPPSPRRRRRPSPTRPSR